MDLSITLMYLINLLLIWVSIDDFKIEFLYSDIVGCIVWAIIWCFSLWSSVDLQICKDLSITLMRLSTPFGCQFMGSRLDFLCSSCI